VVGMAVSMDAGVRPLAARCRIRQGRTGILLKSESRDMTSGELIHEVVSEISGIEDFQNFRNPSSDCALLKCVLVQLGLISVRTICTTNSDIELQSELNRFCCSTSETGNVRLEFISTSLVPQGSGLGTSSILAGCLVAALGRCIGLLDDSVPRDVYDTYLVDNVLQIEQLLSTGGGFQDQVNGLIGGIKCSQTVPNQTNLRIEIDRLIVGRTLQQKLANDAIVLVFTGQTRLAKNLLVNVLRRWSKRTSGICQTVTALVNGAKKCRECIRSNDLDGVGKCLSEYWELKKIMAGPDSGVEPPEVSNLIRLLKDKFKVIRGAALCGAGGGGFLALIPIDGMNASRLQEIVVQDDRQGIENESNSLQSSQYSWHDCKLCDIGLTVIQLEEESISDECNFDITWLSTTS
jgi:fucokinase